MKFAIWFLAASIIATSFAFCQKSPPASPITEQTAKELITLLKQESELRQANRENGIRHRDAIKTFLKSFALNVKNQNAVQLANMLDSLDASACPTDFRVAIFDYSFALRKSAPGATDGPAILGLLAAPFTGGLSVVKGISKSAEKSTEAKNALDNAGHDLIKVAMQHGVKLPLD